MKKNSASNQYWQIFACGMATLLWELACIRWLGSSIRLVSYYTNFVLISCFCGLGAGALAARPKIAKVEHLLVILISWCVALGVIFGNFQHDNLADGSDYVWFGQPAGVSLDEYSRTAFFSSWQLLTIVYLSVMGAFFGFGAWTARLFRGIPPIRAYSYHTAGALAGILLFALCSFWRASPPVWFGLGYTLLLVSRHKNMRLTIGLLLLSVLVCLSVAYNTRAYYWSPYYKIQFQEIAEIRDQHTNRLATLPPKSAYSLTVNNDYHQMMLDLTPRLHELAFLRAWRELYDLPYREIASLPPGPILVVGAGTGNDVAAALRNTDRDVVAVEIDSQIYDLGFNYHQERPYSNARVTLVLDDARSYFEKTDLKFALVVFGFLDSHTLISNLSSLRLDNFVYTKESLARVNELLLPDGEVTISFASMTDWMHSRISGLMEFAFQSPVDFQVPATVGYTYGGIYRIKKSKLQTTPLQQPREVIIPEDNWPFLYLHTKSLPQHYLYFMALISVLALLTLCMLPAGTKSVRLPFIFTGAAFFLLETSNIVTLSLLFGSTWVTNVIVFSAILVFILAANLTHALVNKISLGLVGLAIGIFLMTAYLLPQSWILGIDSIYLRMLVATVIYLGPIFFSSLLFAHLIDQEEDLPSAYGSNVIGAVLGGATEYLSTVVGFKFLLLVATVLYALAFSSVYTKRR